MVFQPQYRRHGGRQSFQRFSAKAFEAPLAAVNNFPALAILEHEDPLGMPVLLQWASPLAGFAFLFVVRQVWEIGVRHYRSTGS